MIINPYIFGGYVYIVDVYSSTAAYSLRKLSSSATVSIRIRRSSDNAEQDIGFSGDALDTTSLASFVGANSAYIVTWYDQAGSYNMTQSTAANQPRIVNAGTIDVKGGVPAIYFDGSNDTLQNVSGGMINATNISHFSVTANALLNTLGTIFSQSTTTINTIRAFNDTRTFKRNLAVSTTTGYYADMSAIRNDTNQRLLCSFIDTSKNMSSFDNGATGGTDTYAGVATTDSAQFGAQVTTPFYLNGYLQEFIAFNTDESANRTDIETNINDYYGIY